ncbi:CG1603 [Drosophila busckii]|uniref:CG1603 n=1 Tax=Drosophila busckii TaxID=30019 RepID=A0A0M5J2G3_DROBS|nr:gastrula zinc finger protein XlCGF48.2 [Drosophila busckii]ALC41156.1 CG1603 [Drosophila busckii]
MEVCGNILVSSDYNRFSLSCIYCSIENEMHDWQQFIVHMRSEHSLDDTEAGSVKIETESIHSENPYEQNEYAASLSDGALSATQEVWEEDYLDFDNDELFEDADDAHSVTIVSEASHTSNVDAVNELFFAESNEYEIVEEKEFKQNWPGLLMDNNEQQNFDESSASDCSFDNSTTRKQRHVMPLKRTLKVSFFRTDPRVLIFIEEFKRHSCLWNPLDTKFGDEKAQLFAHSAIIETMDKKANILFNESELVKSINQLVEQYSIAKERYDENKLFGRSAKMFEMCKFLANSYSPEHDDEEEKSDVIQLNFKEPNDMTSAFINVYANFPVLYDISHKDFKSVDSRTQAYIKMSEELAPEVLVNETEVHLAVLRLRKWAYMALRRVKSKELRRACTKTELHYLQMCNFLPPKSESLTFSCTLCRKRFFIDYSLRAHMVKDHQLGELPYLCSQCPRRFFKPHDLERHKLRQHCEKMFQCEYCDSKFSVPSDLKMHTRVHTGEKPYVCEICGKAFRLKLLLDYHINGRHFDLRPFKCDICNKSYRKRVQLKNHVKVHLNIRDKRCEDCGAAFTCPTSLSRHRKTMHRKINTHST